MSLKQDILDEDEISDLEIEGEDFSYFDFSNKTLENVVFKDVRLISALFEKASLRGVSFISSDLTSALFDSAFLSSCLFSSSLLKGTSFFSSDIRKTTFDNVNGLYTVYTSSSLRDTYIKNSIFKDSDFSSIKAAKSGFNEVEFKSTSFFNTKLCFLSMEKVTFIAPNLSENLKELKGCRINLESAASILKGMSIDLDLSL